MPIQARSIRIPAFTTIFREHVSPDADANDPYNVTLTATRDVMTNPKLQRRVVNREAFKELRRKMIWHGILRRMDDGSYVVTT